MSMPSTSKDDVILLSSGGLVEHRDSSNRRNIYLRESGIPNGSSIVVSHEVEVGCL